MKNLFVCSTQYQLFNIVNIINQSFLQDSNELLIVGFVPELKTRLEKLAKKSRKFSQITFVKTGRANGSLKSYINCLLKMTCPCLIYIRAYEIDRLFITSTEVFSRIIAYKFFQVKQTLKLFYFEDGLESYMEVLNSSINNRTNKFLYKKFGFSLISKCCGMYVYKPQYVISNPHNIMLYSIKPIKLGSSYAKELYELFSMDKPVHFESGSSIFLDAWFVNKIDKADSDKIFSMIWDIIGERLVLKPHPSNYKTLKNNKKGNIIIDSKDNFEIIYMTNRGKDITLISAFSTACLLPKIIFNAEPKVVLLYRLYKRYPDIWKDGEELYLRVQKDYTNPNSFLIPSNQAELEEALRSDVIYC